VASVAVIAMPNVGHVQRLLPLIRRLADRDLTVHVLTGARFRQPVERAGARFFDLFERYPIDAADATSMPVPSRYVTYAAHYADDVRGEVERLGVSLVVYDTFAVVAPLVARMLALPYVNVCTGHAIHPSWYVPALWRDPRVDLAPECLRAVEVLRDRYGVQDASPFSYVSGISPFLNVYCEPPGFLSDAERELFEPVVFLGSLPELGEIHARARARGEPYFDPGGRGPRVYASFGTIIWWYWTTQALDALEAVAEGVARRPGARGVISLGGSEADGRGLERPGVRVESYLDQWRVLAEADVFVTHQGLNSTHEAVFSGVPMVSYPFTADQPGMTAKCRELGIGLPLVHEPRAPITPEDVGAALDEVERRREQMQCKRAWRRFASGRCGRSKGGGRRSTASRGSSPTDGRGPVAVGRQGQHDPARRGHALERRLDPAFAVGAIGLDGRVEAGQRPGGRLGGEGQPPPAVSQRLVEDGGPGRGEEASERPARRVAPAEPCRVLGDRPRGDVGGRPPRHVRELCRRPFLQQGERHRIGYGALEGAQARPVVTHRARQDQQVAGPKRRMRAVGWPCGER
jgi:MGT family glycosyltransferase